jgi:hypothetical protein
MTLRMLCRLSLALGAASAVAILAANMALQDIYHHEPDVTLEWRVVRVSFVVIAAFHVFAMTAAWTALAKSDADPARPPAARTT